jgi:CBS domain-containing protein
MPTGIKVADVMRKSVVTIQPEDPVEKALEAMVKLDIGCVVVSQKAKPIGVITDSNLLERVFAQKLDPSKVKAKNVMTSPLVTISPAEDVEKGAELMRDQGIKRLPVVKQGNLVGILTEKEVVEVSPAIYEILSEKADASKELFPEEELRVEGICDSCGNYSEELFSEGGILVCKSCREE